MFIKASIEHKFRGLSHWTWHQACLYNCNVVAPDQVSLTASFLINLKNLGMSNECFDIYLPFAVAVKLNTELVKTWMGQVVVSRRFCTRFIARCVATLGDDLYTNTVYPKKYAHGFVVLCFVVVMQSFIMNSHEVFIHIHQGCFAGTGAIVRLPQCQWSKPDGYGKISQCITTTKHSKAKTVCIFHGIYCIIL